MTPTPIGDLFDLVVQGEAHASSPGRHPGGEWDPWFALPRRTRRILIGARMARSGALMPDQLADLIVRRHPCLDEPPLDWYFRTALAAIQERRYASNRDRHQRLAWGGSFTPGAFRTYYRYRDARVREMGFCSLWHYRKAKGWR